MRTGRLSILVFLFAAAPSLFGASPRITFERIVAAPQDLHAEEVALIQAIGDHASVETFVEVLVEQVGKSRTLRLRDLRHGIGPADAYLDIRGYTCTVAIREGEGSRRDVDNNRVRRRHMWADALCSARVDVLSKSMQHVASFEVKGEGTSPRVQAVTDDERNIALEQAARYAAITAAERITPRRIRETIVLDEKAPLFADGMAMIDSGRLGDARTIWSDALRTRSRSAGLHYNLAAVCEALGDRDAAGPHYRAARELAPSEPRYALELKLFEKRGK